MALGVGRAHMVGPNVLTAEGPERRVGASY